MAAPRAPFLHRSLAAALALATVTTAELPAAEPQQRTPIPTDFGHFQRDVSPAIRARRLGTDPKHWRQIEPAVFALARTHAAQLDGLPDDSRADTLASLADFIDRQRAVAADRPVIAAGRRIIGLLDPARGLTPQEITTIATAYRSRSTVFKQDPTTGQTIADVAADFLAAVEASAASAAPTTIVVLGHGLPEEIQSYAIPVARLAAALVPDRTPEPASASGDASPAAAPRAVNLGHVVIVCDDCFSADFLVNLLDNLEARCRDAGLVLESLPICIAGTNHGRYGHADVGEAFVPHFWRDVIELFYVRQPRPEAVTLAGFFTAVDSMMYGYGRVPVFNGGRIDGWRVVNPDLVQDPVVFVPLDAAASAELRRILGLPAAAPLPRWLDIG